MIQPICRDVFFLSRPSRPAQIQDSTIGADLLDTLKANQERCVGMAANMIGQAVRIIAVDNGGEYLLMYDPEILKREGPTKPKRAASPWRAPGRSPATKRSRSATETRSSRPASKPFRILRPRLFSMNVTTWRGRSYEKPAAFCSGHFHREREIKFLPRRTSGRLRRRPWPRRGLRACRRRRG